MCKGKNLKDRPTVYVAGPYSSDPVMGIRAAIQAANEIWAAGGAPYVPHLTHFWHCISPKPYGEWLELDLIWLSRCEVLVRLPGISSGADKEVLNALRAGIPVYHNLLACLACIRRCTDKAPGRHRERCKLCYWCAEGWPVHYAGKSLGWVHTQPEELAPPNNGPQVWERCLACQLQEQK